MIIYRRLRCVKQIVQVRQLTHHAPQASEDQVFRDSDRLGTSLGTEEEWQAAVRDQQLGNIARANPKPEHEQDDASVFATNRIGQVVLPRGLTEATESLLKGTHSKTVRQTAERFHISLQSKNEGKKAPVPMPASADFTDLEADAYLAGFMPQIYASVHTVLTELRKRLGKDWTPQSVLDCGIGPGAGAYAYQEVFIDSNPHKAEKLPDVTIAEPNYELKRRTRKIWTENCTLAPKISDTKGPPHQQYDLILAPHALDDCKGRPTDRLDLVRDLWARLAPNGILLLLERGNPAGFERVAAARQHLLRRFAFGQDETETAHVIAPCPGDGQCPMYLEGHDPKRQSWCRFSQRLQRPEFLQRLRTSKLNTEDVNYSYILVRKGPRPSPPTRSSQSAAETTLDVTAAMSDKDIVSSSYGWSRIILPPLKRHKHIILDICSSHASSGPSASSVRQLRRLAKPNTKAKFAAFKQQLADAAAEEAALRRAKEAELQASNDTSDRKWSDMPGPVLQRATVPKSQGTEEYKFARRAHWGDLLPFRGKIVIDRAALTRKEARDARKEQEKAKAIKTEESEGDLTTAREDHTAP